MKKIIFGLVLLVLFIIPNKTVDAAKQPSYNNILDMSMLKYDDETGFFYSDQQIELKTGTTYTVVASKGFFGERIVNWDDLEGKFFLANYETTSASNLVLSFAFSISETGLHYTTVTVGHDCIMTIKNFLSKGFTLETFKRDEVVMFEGDMSKFDGFRRYVNLDGYEKVGSEVNIYTDIANKISIDTITESIVAKDNQDGLITDIKLTKDEYSSSTTTGMFIVTYEATDANGNKTNLTVYVNVVDGEKPVISGPSVVEWELGNPCPTLDDLISNFTAIDNVDGDITNKISISSSGLGNYEQYKEGRYMVCLQVADKAGNVGSYNFFLDVKDTVAPEVEVKDVTINLSESFSTLENLAHEVFVDAYDASKSTRVSYSYGEYLDEIGFAGKYEITVTVKDPSENATVKTAYLTIVDDISPEFYMKIHLLNTGTNKVYDVAAVKSVIERKLNEDGILYEDVQLISSDYFGNEKTPGEYNVKFLCRYKDSVNYMVGTIVVEETPTVSVKSLLICIGAFGGIILFTYLYKRKRSMI